LLLLLLPCCCCPCRSQDIVNLFLYLLRLLQEIQGNN
jgi:hypothetical protein